MSYAHRIFRLIFLSFIVFFTACKKPPTTPISLKNGTFRFLDSKLKLSYKSDEDDFGAKVKLRMQRDSLIWASITGPLGAEGVRAEIDKDSIYIIDRINKQFLQSSLDTLDHLLKFRTDFSILEAILLGNMPFPDLDPGEVSNEGKYRTIIQEKNGITISNLVNTKTQKLEKLVLMSQDPPNTLEIKYASFNKRRGILIPNKTDIQVSYREADSQQQKTIQIALDRLKIEIGDEPITFPFYVPDKYRQPNSP